MNDPNIRTYVNIFKDDRLFLLTVTSPFDTRVNSTLPASPISGSLVIIVCTRVPTSVNCMYLHNSHNM